MSSELCILYSKSILWDPWHHKIFEYDPSVPSLVMSFLWTQNKMILECSQDYMQGKSSRFSECHSASLLRVYQEAKWIVSTNQFHIDSWTSKLRSGLFSIYSQLIFSPGVCCILSKPLLLVPWWLWICLFFFKSSNCCSFFFVTKKRQGCFTAVTQYHQEENLCMKSILTSY